MFQSLVMMMCLTLFAHRPCILEVPVLSTIPLSQHTPPAAGGGEGGGGGGDGKRVPDLCKTPMYCIYVYMYVKIHVFLVWSFFIVEVPVLSTTPVSPNTKQTVVFGISGSHAPDIGKELCANQLPVSCFRDFKSAHIECHVFVFQFRQSSL